MNLYRKYRWCSSYSVLLFFGLAISSCKNQKKQFQETDEAKVLEQITFEIDSASLAKDSTSTIYEETMEFLQLQESFLGTDTKQGSALFEEIEQLSLPFYVPQGFVMNTIIGEEPVNLFQDGNYYSASQNLNLGDNVYDVEIFGTSQGYLIETQENESNPLNEDLVFSNSEDGGELSFSKHGVAYRISVSDPNADPEEDLSAELEKIAREIYNSLVLIENQNRQ